VSTQHADALLHAYLTVTRRNALLRLRPCTANASQMEKAKSALS
jgi:hypothetical protein